ncbi:MAG: accessory factor UbiK family protein [Wenzhouxiangella sp.]|jgi:BMFP domain-containing protein YqiC|nr:accessory factor UbiK family protein [Wenzhouxiangella sp.]MDR9452476.1 accessory factor UbiK family protein [Wenzhouxiangella sp.]
MRVDFQTIDDLAHKLAQALPEPIRSAQAGVEQQFRQVLEKGLARMDLVTREEFEAQKKVLERAEQKLAELEQRLSADQ